MASTNYATLYDAQDPSYPHIYPQSELGYPSERDSADHFASQFVSWSPENRKRQIQHSQIQQQFMQQVSAQPRQTPPQLTVQTHIGDVEHMKSLSLYSATSSHPQTPIRSPLSGSDSQPPTQAFGDSFEMTSDWQRNSQQQPSMHGYHSQAHYTQHHPHSPHANSAAHVKSEAVSSPITPGYPSQNHFYNVHSSEGLHTPNSQYPYQDQVPSPYYGRTTPPQQVDPSEFGATVRSPAYAEEQQLACDPRYVSQEGSSNSSEGVTELPYPSSLHPSQAEAYELQDQATTARAGEESYGASKEETDLLDAEGEEDVDVAIAHAAGVMSPLVSAKDRSYPPSELDEEHDEGDIDYDPRDGEYVYRYRPSARTAQPAVPMGMATDGNRSMHLRSTVVRYAPYPAFSPTSETYVGEPAFGATRVRRSVSNAASISSISSSSSSSSYLPLTPTSPTGRHPHSARPSNSLPIPVPVPHLTKKSRGRRVPTADVLEAGRGPGLARLGLDNGEFGHDSNPVSAMKGTRGITGGRKGAAKGVRMFTCKVPGCGKCFARGEHLKRHVRSIHTHEKPHKCPYPGCGKDFSRHDNLGQHMRVHKDWVPPPKTTIGYRI